MDVEICENCGMKIGKLEMPHVCNNHVVCQECYKRLKKSISPHGGTGLSILAKDMAIIGIFIPFVWLVALIIGHIALAKNANDKRAKDAICIAWASFIFNLIFIACFILGIMP